MQVMTRGSFFSCSVMVVMLMQAGAAWAQGDIIPDENETANNSVQSEQVALIHRGDATMSPADSYDSHDYLVIEHKPESLESADKLMKGVSEEVTDRVPVKPEESMGRKSPANSQPDNRAVRMIRNVIWMSLFYSGSN